MSKFELSLAKDYVPDWTVVDFDYDPLTETLSIGNKLSVLKHIAAWHFY